MDRRETFTQFDLHAAAGAGVRAPVTLAGTKDLKNEHEAAETEYMLRRSLAICLTDAKSAIARGVDVGFSVTDSSDPDSLIVFSRPLLVLMNSVRMAESFHGDVIAPFLGSGEAGRTEPSGVINWEETSANYINGNRTIVFADVMFNGSKADAAMLCLLLEELTGQLSIVRTIFAKSQAPRHDAIHKALAMWSWMCTTLGDLLDRIPSVSDTRRWAKGAIAYSLTAFGGYLEDLIGGVAANESYSSYNRLSNAAYDSLGASLRLGASAMRWRERYTAKAVGLGAGSHLRFAQTRDAAHLFEIWSFLELSYLLHRRGATSVVQRSFLKGSQHGATFDIGDTRSAYYNYYGDAAVSGFPVTSKIITRSHVEWFIRDMLDPPNSVIIDTKYADWTARECRNVLGYLMEFGVNNGAIIFRGPIPDGALNARDACSNWAICEVGDLGKKTLFVASLSPSLDHLSANERTLSKMTATLNI